MITYARRSFISVHDTQQSFFLILRLLFGIVVFSVNTVSSADLSCKFTNVTVVFLSAQIGRSKHRILCSKEKQFTHKGL